MENPEWGPGIGFLSAVVGWWSPAFQKRSKRGNVRVRESCVTVTRDRSPGDHLASQRPNAGLPCVP